MSKINDKDKTFIKVYITKTMRFRARIHEPENYPYEVTVGGREWYKNNKGRKHENAIKHIIKKHLKNLESSFNYIWSEN